MNDDLNNLSPEQVEERERKKRIKKYITLPLTIFLLILLIVYLFPGDLLQIIESSFVSNKLNNFEIQFQSGEVVFKKEIYEELKGYYLKNQKREIKVCLIGEKLGEIYHVKKLIIPLVLDSSVTHIKTQQCPIETLISLHSHPFKRCIFSEQDIKYYGHLKERNKDAIIGVMCDINQFGFYP